jgi:S-disulfanyl-L-cysteine oxidoreductase SoxD
MTVSRAMGWRVAAALVLSPLCLQPALADGSAPEGQAAAPGAAEYAAHCANCHGAHLEGGVHAPPLIGSVFGGNWAGKRARLLYSRIISTMPQNDPGTLTSQQALAITLYVFSLNGIGWPGHPLSSPNDLNALTIPAGQPSAAPPASK